MHDVVVTDIAVGKHHLIDAQLWNELGKLVFRVNRNSFIGMLKLKMFS